MDSFHTLKRLISLPVPTRAPSPLRVCAALSAIIIAYRLAQVALSSAQEFPLLCNTAVDKSRAAQEKKNTVEEENRKSCASWRSCMSPFVQHVCCFCSSRP